MKVLVACEYSGEVRRAFRARGHIAWSCDLQPALDQSPHHIRGDALAALRADNWDMLLAFPPCTHLSVSGARWLTDHWVQLKGRKPRWHDGSNKRAAQVEGIAFFMAFINADVPKIAVENPVSVMSTRYRKPDQIIQPWQFGHGETKATCLWLKGLTKLVPTNVVSGREARVWRMAPGPGRANERSKTFPGIAEAMASQWGQPSLAGQTALPFPLPLP